MSYQLLIALIHDHFFLYDQINYFQKKKLDVLELLINILLAQGLQNMRWLNIFSI